MKKGKVWMLDPDASFKPPGKVKQSINKLGYEYVEHCDQVKDPKAVKEKYTDYIPPRNILGGNSKRGEAVARGPGVLTGGVLFGFGEREPGAFPEHMPDDYDAARKQRKKELEEHHSKVQEMAFKGLDYGNKFFQSNEEAFGGYEHPTHVPRDPQPDTAIKFPHESPFRPTNPMKRDAVGCLMGGIPELLDAMSGWVRFRVCPSFGIYGFGNKPRDSLQGNLDGICRGHSNSLPAENQQEKEVHASASAKHS
ncbi:unnamed protein product [Effrenium voratum]|nr:unnamed protein product [Effrenium voratum]